MDIEAVKSRVRKLMALANDGQASDGEISNAMRMAAALIDQHRLDAAALEDEDDAPESMGRAPGRVTTSKVHRWESTLTRAICDLFGNVDCYLDASRHVVRVNGIVQVDRDGEPRLCRQFQFYGPALEAQEAAALYTEWASLIATMGVVRWGGAFRGNGACYCEGFADAILAEAQRLNASRRTLPMPTKARALPGVAPGTAIMLADRNKAVIERAHAWLKESECITLTSGHSRTGGRGSSAAYSEGKAHGAAAGFGRRAARRALPAGGGV